MDAEQILVGIAIIVGLAVACQILAPVLRTPALVLLLPAGFIAGIVFPSANASEILGEAFSPLVNIAVGLILFHGGLELVEERVDRPDKKIIRRLIFIGALVTCASASWAAYAFLGLPPELAVLLGAIVIVSGPTVVAPLLAFAKPQMRIRRILAWEGTLIDPVGALVAVIVFQGVQLTSEPTVFDAVNRFVMSILIGVVGGLIGLAMIWLGMLLAGPSKVLGTQVLLGAVIATTALTDAVSDDSGLVAAVIMGMVVPLIDRERLAAVKPFFDTVVSFAIGVLFISISALVSPSSLQGLVLPTLGIVALLVLVVRPVTAYVLTARSTLTSRERLYIGWMAPRGIVAAATASSFSATLIAANVPGAEKLLPATFVIIAGTVLFYSATAVPMAKLLKVRDVEEVAEPADLPPLTLP
ncbi:MAG: cation:proton antiporter [Actinobacteria bacterium]|nr:cation:proton antiporter [Actinomycetota bacterium]